ncbi:MAG: hypothetical protein IKC24_07385 [Oscillospiraceae bacterium]|nr:hypothetical protein [Oscillospiraceae bacterium]
MKTKMDPKQWFLRTLAVCLAALILCAAINVGADPFFYYRWDSDGEGIFFNQRYQNAGIARNAEMDTLLLGTSMVSNFRPSYLEQSFGGSAAKITIPDGRFKEFSQILDTVYRKHSPKRVLFSLDLNILVRDESTLQNELPKYLYDRNPFNDVQYVFNKDTLLYSIYTLRNKANGEAVPCDDAFTWDKTAGFSTNFVLASYTRPEKAETEKSRNAFHENVAANLSHVVAWAEEHPETEFIIYIPPYNILYWDKTAYNGETDAVFGALQQCFETLLPIENIRLCQFLNFDMVQDCSYYNDYIHFSGLGAQEVLKAMESGEFDVTEENLVETLRAVRTFQQEYDYEALLAKDPDYVPPADAESGESAEGSTDESEEQPEAEDAASEATE